MNSCPTDTPYERDEPDIDFYDFLSHRHPPIKVMNHKRY